MEEQVEVSIVKPSDKLIIVTPAGTAMKRLEDLVAAISHFQHKEVNALILPASTKIYIVKKGADLELHLPIKPHEQVM